MNDPVVRDETPTEDETLMELALHPNILQELDSLFKVSAVDTLALGDTRRC
ncbi:hypothetical protein [Achromobacter aloeverae]|uniref:hypothetical protein n=1 Tax=Achromobacter aloeverae TaxID=1750518 RepID=UPI001301731A|nr:hypothetical protein [Achromobacter aloeverae]